MYYGFSEWGRAVRAVPCFRETGHFYSDVRFLISTLAVELLCMGYKQRFTDGGQVSTAGESSFHVSLFQQFFSVSEYTAPCRISDAKILLISSISKFPDLFLFDSTRIGIHARLSDGLCEEALGSLVPVAAPGLLDGLHYFQRAGYAVHTGASDVDVFRFKIREDALQRVLLVETHVGIAVAVLYTHDEVANDGHAETVACELLVGHLRVVLLRLNELVVEIQVV